MKLKDLLEGRHPHDQYYRAKPKSQFKWKPRPKKTLWYNGDQFDNWSADIRTRFSDATAYYDEESEEVVACSGDMKKSYGRWRKKDKEGRNGVSFYKPRPVDTVTHNRKRLRLATEGFDMILKELLEMEDDETFPGWLKKQYEERAAAEREAGGSVEVNPTADYIAVKLSNGEEYTFQGHEVDALMAEVPDDVDPEDFILAIAQNW